MSHWIEWSLDSGGWFRGTPHCDEPEGADCRITCNHGCESWHIERHADGSPFHTVTGWDANDYYHDLVPSTAGCNVVNWLNGDPGLLPELMLGSDYLFGRMDIEPIWSEDEYCFQPIRKAVLFDMDGTLCDVRTARIHVTSKPKNFDAFHRAAEECPAHEQVAEAAYLAKQQGLHVIIVTARMKMWEESTLRWLIKNRIPFDRIYMRPDKDYRRDVEIKQEILAQIRKDGYAPVMAWDDNPAIIELWESEKVPVQLVPGWETSPLPEIATILSE